MVGIEVDQVSKSFSLEDGSNLGVIDKLSFSLSDGEFFSLVGPSGCGKSTMLNIIAGLMAPDSGSVIFGNRNGENPRIGFVFQEPTLLDWRTVGENLELALKGMGVPEEQHESRIAEVLNLVGLAEFENEYPQSLSGGMRQRVGLSRAFCVDPDVLLMDEPFGSLDEITARKLRADLLDIWKEQERTILFVTHDIAEAVFLSDRIGILSRKPTNIERTISVEIPRPRNSEDPEILEYENRVIEQLEVPELA